LPSRRDADASAADGAIWIIAAGGIVGCWRAVKEGAILGAFEPLNIDFAWEGCTKVAPSPEGHNPFSTYESRD